MVPIEPQRTHIHFDGICDVFGALGVKLIVREVEGRQRPVGADDSSEQNCVGRFKILAAHVERGSLLNNRPLVTDNELHVALQQGMSKGRLALIANAVVLDIQTRHRPLGVVL